MIKYFLKTDSLEFLTDKFYNTNNHPFYRVEIDGWLTEFRSMKTEELVGWSIHNCDMLLTVLMSSGVISRFVPITVFLIVAAFHGDPSKRKHYQAAIELVGECFVKIKEMK